MLLASARTFGGFTKERVLLYSGNEIVKAPIDLRASGELGHNTTSGNSWNVFTQKLFQVDSTLQNVVLSLNAVKLLVGPRRPGGPDQVLPLERRARRDCPQRGERE